MKLIRNNRTAISAAVLLSLALPIPSSAEEQSHEQVHRHHSFEDMGRWIALFEDPRRQEWQKPEKVVEAIGLKKGDVVADIGAGTGYFTRLFATAVAPSGKAIGLDTEPGMVEYMKRDARERGLNTYSARVVKPDDPGLDPDSTDVVFICDTLHHIDDRVAYLKRISASLRPHGRVVIVDFYKKSLPVGPPPAMKLSKDEVIREFSEAGYRLIRSHDFLPYQYFLEFGL